MQRIKMLVALVLAALVFSGCTSRLVDFTVISSKNVEGLKFDPAGKGARVEGSDSVWWFLFIPFGQPNLKEAIDQAIESAGPGYDALIDGVVYGKFTWMLLVSKSGYKVEGTPVKSSTLKVSELQRKGRTVLFHSSLGISNEEAVRKIGIIRVADLKNLKGKGSASWSNQSK
jgi:hypothetical protein